LVSSSVCVPSSTIVAFALLQRLANETSLHAMPLQNCLPHATPHAPQLFGSFVRIVHCELQHVWPFGHGIVSEQDIFVGPPVSVVPPSGPEGSDVPHATTNEHATKNALRMSGSSARTRPRGATCFVVIRVTANARARITP